MIGYRKRSNRDRGTLAPDPTLIDSSPTSIVACIQTDSLHEQAVGYINSGDALIYNLRFGKVLFFPYSNLVTLKLGGNRENTSYKRCDCVAVVKHNCSGQTYVGKFRRSWSGHDVDRICLYKLRPQAHRRPDGLACRSSSLVLPLAPSFACSLCDL